MCCTCLVLLRHGCFYVTIGVILCMAASMSGDSWYTQECHPEAHPLGKNHLDVPLMEKDDPDRGFQPYFHYGMFEWCFKLVETEPEECYVYFGSTRKGIQGWKK